MKKYLTAMFICVATAALCQSKTETTTKELAFEIKSADNTLMIENINGNVKVEGYSGAAIQLQIEKTISGKTTERIEKGLQEIQYGVIDRADTLIVYIQAPCIPYGYRNRQVGNDNSGWGYDWQNCREREQEYEYKFNFTVKVPQSINVSIGTINDGDVEVKNVTGRVKAFNVNGSIRLAGVNEVAKANTINGDVDIEYLNNPKEDSRFYTLNGDINALFKKGLSSNVSFKSFNGEFYTNLPELEALPAELEKLPSNKGIKYKINGNRYKTGSGGAHLDFETFNGNVYLKEK